MPEERKPFVGGALVYNAEHFQGIVNVSLNPRMSSEVGAWLLELEDTPDNKSMRALGYALKNRGAEAREFRQNGVKMRNGGKVDSAVVHDSGAELASDPDDEYTSRIAD